MAIVYFHRRKDTNEVFYVGIGKKKYRARDKQGRNHYWWHIVKNVGYTIEIVNNDIDYQEAMDLEIKYIKQFGRKDLGLGNLVNLTDGGNVITGYNHKEETKEKISQSNIGKTLTKEHIENLKNNHKGMIGKNHSEESKDKMSITQKKIWNTKEGLEKRNKSNTFRKLTEENVIEAIELYKSGKMNYYQLADKYRVARPTISRAIKGESWKYLQEKRVEKAEGIKLTEQEVIYIRKEYTEGNISQIALSKKYGVKQSTISQIINRKRWKHI